MCIKELRELFKYSNRQVAVYIFHKAKWEVFSNTQFLLEMWNICARYQLYSKYETPD